MLEPLTWVIFVVGYAPLHFLAPVMLALFTGTETPDQRRRLLKGVVIDCSLSMGVAFLVAIWLAGEHLQAAMLVLLIALCVPYTYLWIHRRRLATRWFPDDTEH